MSKGLGSRLRPLLAVCAVLPLLASCDEKKEAAAPPASPAVHTQPGKPSAAVPTVVESGAGSLEDGPSALALAALGGLVVVGAGAGAWGFRRSLRP